MMRLLSKAFLPLLLVSFTNPLLAQQPAQTLRGRVVDQQSLAGITGATILLQENGATTLSDSAGYFSLSEVPVGRVSLLATHHTYEPLVLTNIVVESGRETVQDIKMQEQMRAGAPEVIVRGKRKLTHARMATLSAVDFNAEDTRRYAGSRNDVARMAANFAGVNSNNDSRNDLVIRGNSPLGLLWRLEGIDIPNPNHFGGLGATGGPVGMLNNNVLGQSAFFTGAFPAQYGNATSGVFDLSLRTGNTQKREYAAQVGFNGLEVGAEGYFTKKSKASYLVYYRYSIPGLLQSLGVNIGTGAAAPAYQDLSMKITLPTAKAGTFTLFGIGGLSEISFKGQLKDTSNFYNDPYHNLYNNYKMGVAGIRHSYFLNSTTSSVITIGATGSHGITRQDSLDLWEAPHKRYRQDGREWRYVASLVLNKKISARDRVTAGLTAEQLHFNYQDSLQDALLGFVPLITGKDHTCMGRGFAQWQHRFSPRLTMNSGINGQWLALTKQLAVDGRLGLRYAMGSGAFSLAWGSTSQLQLLMMYYYTTSKAGGEQQTNRDLRYTRSQQLVADWEGTFLSQWKYKVETYGQWLSKVPVEKEPSAWSGLNTGAGFGTVLEDSLVSEGKGYNYGLELTVEKPFSKGYYVLGTLSLFDSRYKGSNGVWHHTAFNGQYVLNGLAGREWQIKDRHAIAVDVKGTFAGGRRYTPILEAASQIAHRAVYDDEQAFALRTSPYLRLDLKLTYRMHAKAFMQEFFVDFQNITNHQNVFTRFYDSRSGRVRTQYQLGFWPNFNYRIQF